MPSSPFDAPKPPASALGRTRILSAKASIRVSPLCLGTMSIGNDWNHLLGAITKEEAFNLLDSFVAMGGNFIDTANNYQAEESEKWIGEWMAARKNRDHLIVATKYTMSYRGHAEGINETINSTGNSRRSLHVSVRDSLKKLQTDWIDILYVHWWDFVTSVEELMDSLHIMVQQGKVLYLGISDSPAWFVAACNEYARAHGKTEFVVYQGNWNVLLRDFERDILPMARHYGMAICPFGAVGGGKLLPKHQIEVKRAEEGAGIRNSAPLTPAQEAMSGVLSEISKEIGLGDNPPVIALAYLLCKAPYVFPLVGGRKVEHLGTNIKALEVKLTTEQIDKIEAAQPFEIGFPHSFIGIDPRIDGGKTTGRSLGLTGNIDFVLASKAVAHV